MGAVAVLLVVFVVLTAVFIVWPATNDPQRVDAIVVLGGQPPTARWQRGVELARDGYARVLVLSNHPWMPCPRGPSRVEVICFEPDPASTLGEAVDVSRLAAEHHWRSLLIVTNTAQVSRARIRFQRCYHGTMLFASVSPGWIAWWLWYIPYEWAALGKALIFQRACGSAPMGERLQTVSPTYALAAKRN